MIYVSSSWHVDIDMVRGLSQQLIDGMVDLVRPEQSSLQPWLGGAMGFERANFYERMGVNFCEQMGVINDIKSDLDGFIMLNNH